MVHTSMHDLMLGMFVGGVVLAAPPLLIGLAVGLYMLQQRRRENRQDLRDDTVE
jgi:hypothetical protein